MKTGKKISIAIMMVIFMVAIVVVCFINFGGKTETTVIETESFEDFSNKVTEGYGTLESDSEFATKTLIVTSEITDFPTYNAVSDISNGSIHVLSYKTEKAASAAYKKLLKNEDIISVEIDSIVEVETLTGEDITVGAVDSNTENKEISEVVVAIIDSGIDKNNSLFSDRIIDTDINYSTSGEGIQDDNGHGTAVASIIAKNSNAKLMPMKIANSDGKSTVLSLYLAIQAAIENEADVINLSLTTSSSDLLTSIIDEAIGKGIIVVAAAGNQSANVENYAPANIESVITVAATDQDYKPASYSNYGSFIDYAAVGTNVEVETLNGTEKMSGTSLSAAYVSAVMAYAKENDKSFNDFVYAINNDPDYYGKGIVSLEEIDTEKEFINVEGFDFKIIQSFLNEVDRDNYKLQILTNADVEYTFDGGETWQKSNYIEINRNQEFYDGNEYVTSIRTLGIKDADGNTKFKDYTVIDCNNPNDPDSMDIELETNNFHDYSNMPGGTAKTLKNNGTGTEIDYNIASANTTYKVSSYTIPHDGKYYLLWETGQTRDDSYTLTGILRVTTDLAVGTKTKVSGKDYYQWKATDSGAENAQIHICLDLQEGDTVAFCANSTATGGMAFRRIIQEYSFTNTLIYRANGGTGAPTSQSETSYSNSASSFTISSTTPTRSGYEFKGWGESSSATSATYTSGNSIPVSGTKYIWAVWEQTYSHTLSYDANGGSGAPDSSSVTNTSSTYNMTVSSTTPTKTGHTFTGWLYNGTVYQGGGSVPVGPNATVTLTAQWTPSTYTLTVNPNGGTMYYNDANTTTSSFNIKFLYGANRHLGTFTDNYYGHDGYNTVGKPKRVGYTFSGWNVTSGGGTVNYYSVPDAYGYKTDDFSQAMSRPHSWAYYLYDGNYAGDTTITAQWTPNTYTLTLNPNGGTYNNTTSTSTKTMTYDSSNNNGIGTPSRTGYTFKGWYTAASGGIPVFDINGYAIQHNRNTTYWNGGSTWSDTWMGGSYSDWWNMKWNYANNLTLYAQWTPNNYNLDINPDYNKYGTAYSNGAKVKSFDLSISSDPYTGTGLEDYCNTTGKYGCTYTIRNIKYRAGYHFDSYTLRNDANEGISNCTITSQSSTGITFNHSVAGNMWLSINTAPNTNTPYTVKHWKQNIGGNASSHDSANYTLADTENKTGTTDTSVTPAVKSYTGFTAPATQTININGDGSAVVNYYYTRNNYYFDLNGWLDGAYSGSLGNYGTADVYINDSLVANDVADYYAAHPYGSKYEIKDIKATASHKYNGVHSGSLSGTITGDTSVVLDFNTVYTVTYNGNGSTGGSTASQTFDYGSSVKISANGFTRTGYTFVNWNTKADGTGTTYEVGQEYATNSNLTLYAQWKKSITYSFNYFQNKNASVTVIFHNKATKAKLTSFINGATYDVYDDTTEIKEANGITVSSLTNDVTYDGYTWTSRGITYNNSTSYAKVDYTKGTTSISALAEDGEAATNTINYYVSYERTPQLTLISYGDNKQESQVIKGTVTKNGKVLETAGLTYAGNVDRTPEFTFPDLANMKLKEANAAGNTVNEGWYDETYNKSIGSKSIGEKLGWTTSKDADAKVEQAIGSKKSTYKDATYYGLYSKEVTITYDPNGGTVNPTTASYTRYVNASDVTKATKSDITFAVPTWKENGKDKYIWCGWLYKKLAVDGEKDTFTNYLVGTTNNAGSFTYTPLVSDTVYAYWVTDIREDLRPSHSIIKTAEWATPTSDNSAVDFDNLRNIDTDGIAKVTVKLTITNKESIGARSIKVTDYFDTDKWVYYQDDTHKVNTSTGSINRSNNEITWMVPDSYTSGREMTLTYYVKLKESYWNVDKDNDYYINAIQDLASYKNELDENGDLIIESNYQTVDEKALVNLKYVINGGLLSGMSVNTYNSTPYVTMRPVNWVPTTFGLQIETGKNVYRDLTSGIYNKTYFVQYDTKSTDSSNSTFKITSNASMRRSYPFYQITDSFLDIYKDSTNQVIDNNIGLNVERSNTVSDVTAGKKANGYGAEEYLKIVAADNIHTPVTTGSTETGFVQYKYGALTSVDTMYATNKDNAKFSIYPFVKSTNSKLNTTYETTRDRSILANQRLDITIDATDPIITPDDRVKTESEKYGAWTESDGYADINLVDDHRDPKAKAKTLTFKFEDNVSGVSAPSASTSDWINYSNQNVQVKLERVDNEPLVIFDSASNANNISDIVKVNYTSTSGLNKTGNVQINLDPTNDDILGHLKLTIRVYDNVSNWTEKTYDLYVFCLTGEISIVDTIPSYSERLEELNNFRNGEMGTVKISANGFVDRVTVDYGTYLNAKFSQEAAQRFSFANDRIDTLDGDYPKTDLDSVGNDSLITTTNTEGIPILPYAWQVCRWGYKASELGGVRLSEVEMSRFIYEADNTILQEHLDDLIERYQGIANGTSYGVEKGSDYAIVDSTLYTSPTMNGDDVVSYTDRYELGGETYYDDILYPSYITLNGTKGITITYESVAPEVEEAEDVESEETEDVEDPDEVETEEDEPRRRIVASVEDTTEIILSNWVHSGDSNYRPFVHYFFMPLGAEEKASSDPYYVTLTAYKDSEKDFKHSVSVKLSFTNSGSILDDIIVIIKDN